MRSHSNAAQGGINAAVDEDDTWEDHAFDTVKGSDYLGDQDAIEVLCSEAGREVLALERMGVIFHRDETATSARAPSAASSAPAPTSSATSPARRCCTSCTSS